MSVRGRCATGALLLLAGAAFAQAAAAEPPAQAVPDVDPNVDAVVQGGRWNETGVGEGRYRVVVVSSGFEHVSSRMSAEWKADGDESGAAKIVHAVELVAPGAYSLDAPTITANETGVRVEVTGTATHAPDRRVTCRFDLAPGGRRVVVRACGD